MSPFRRLVVLFVSRIMSGASGSGDDEFDLGIGVTTILLTMPGLLVSLLLFEKYGSLMHFFRGDFNFDPFSAAVPDEYLFIVLSMAVTGIATVWKATAIFPDRRDFANLVHLPLSMASIGLANLLAIGALAALYSVAVSAASVVLFPIAVFGSTGSVTGFLRFFLGHTLTVFASGIFSFTLVFAAFGFLLFLLPFAVSRRIFIAARFVLIAAFLALIVTAFTVPDLLAHSPAPMQRVLAALPSVWFLGFAQWFWHSPYEAANAAFARLALAASLLIPAVACACFFGAFRRGFQKIPELPESPSGLTSSPRADWLGRLALRALFRDSTDRSLAAFVSRVLFRSEAHQQVVLFFLCLGLVVSAQLLSGTTLSREPRASISAEVLAVPLILAACVIIGLRLSFEIPFTLHANWIFRFLLDADSESPRSTARRLLLYLSLGWLLPLSFAAIYWRFGLWTALLHALVLCVVAGLIIELSLLNFRKIPFTCSSPPFRSNSPVLAFAWVLGILLMAIYIPQAEIVAVQFPWVTFLLAIPAAAVYLGLWKFRKDMLAMDKAIMFEELEDSLF
jgi:hypothetical protein